MQTSKIFYTSDQLQQPLTLKMSQITTDMVMRWLNGQRVSIYSAYARPMLTLLKLPTVFRQERPNDDGSDQSSSSGSASSEQHDTITEPITMGLLKVKDIYITGKSFLCSAYADHILGIR